MKCTRTDAERILGLAAVWSVIPLVHWTLLPPPTLGLFDYLVVALSASAFLMYLVAAYAFEIVEGEKPDEEEEDEEKTKAAQRAKQTYRSVESLLVVGTLGIGVWAAAIWVRPDASAGVIVVWSIGGTLGVAAACALVTPVFRRSSQIAAFVTSAACALMTSGWFWLQDDDWLRRGLLCGGSLLTVGAVCFAKPAEDDVDDESDEENEGEDVKDEEEKKDEERGRKANAKGKRKSTPRSAQSTRSARTKLEEAVELRRFNNRVCFVVAVYVAALLLAERSINAAQVVGAFALLGYASVVAALTAMRHSMLITAMDVPWVTILIFSVPARAYLHGDGSDSVAWQAVCCAATGVGAVVLAYNLSSKLGSRDALVFCVSLAFCAAHLSFGGFAPLDFTNIGVASAALVCLAHNPLYVLAAAATLVEALACLAFALQPIGYVPLRAVYWALGLGSCVLAAVSLYLVSVRKGK